MLKVTDDGARAEIQQDITQVLADMRRLPGIEAYLSAGHKRNC